MAHPLFSPNFDNTQVARTVALLENQMNNKVKAGLLELLNVLILKNAMIQVPVPCTLRFLAGGHITRASDLGRVSAVRLSRENIENILELDKILSEES